MFKEDLVLELLLGRDPGGAYSGHTWGVGVASSVPGCVHRAKLNVSTYSHKVLLHTIHGAPVQCHIVNDIAGSSLRSFRHREAMQGRGGNGGKSFFLYIVRSTSYCWCYTALCPSLAVLCTAVLLYQPIFKILYSHYIICLPSNIAQERRTY